MAKKPVIFLDRDGTVIVECNYLADPERVELLPGAVAGMRRFRELGYLLVMVTNQAGVGRGFFDISTVRAVNVRLAELLAVEGLGFDGVYFCPHHPDAGCHCRKPAPGMIEQACQDLDIDLGNSVMIGDRASDIGLGKSCDLKTILVLSGYGKEASCSPDFIAGDLLEAAEWVAKTRD